MSLIQIVIMVVAGIGMVVGLMKQKAGAEWGKPVAIGCIVVALVAALWSSFRTLTGGSTQGVVDREVQFQRIEGKKLGMYLAEKYKGSKALILLEPKVSGGQQKEGAKENPLITGLKEGFGSGVTVAAEVTPEIPEDKAKAFAKQMPMEGMPPGPAGAAGRGEMMPPLDYWFTAKVFDALLKKNEGQFDLLVTVIGLPADARASTVLKGKSCPKIAVLNGSIYDLKNAIRPNMVVAAVTYNPKAQYDDKPAPKDVDEAFNKRFLLVTPDSIQQIATQFPEIFRGG
jgi:hypothetical protein